MGRNHMIRTSAAAVIGCAIAVSPLATPASAGSAGVRIMDRQSAGPCALIRNAGESTEDFSIRIITCAAEKWPVPGGAVQAVCVAQRESGLNPSASSATGEYLGLFQHSAAAWPDRYDEWTRPAWGLKRSALNGRTNAVVTMRMVNADGWGPWSGLGC